MEWLRLYSNIVNDPKIMTMSEKYRWRYVALLCLFRIKSDSFPTESEIIFSMRIKKQEWELTKKEFEKRGLIIKDTINGWTTRQYKSDDSYARVKRFRNVSETPELKDVTVTVTPPETETETETELKESFDRFRKAYPGTKRGLDVEYDNLKNCCKKHKLKISKIIPLLKPAIENKKKAIDIILRKNPNAFIAEYKHLVKWINDQCWTEETPIINQGEKW